MRSRLALTECEAKFSRLSFKGEWDTRLLVPLLNPRSQSKISLEENNCILDFKFHLHYQMSLTTPGT